MRTHIYTNKEKEAIRSWLAGSLNRRESFLLNKTLLRTKHNRNLIITDIHLLFLTLRKLSAGHQRTQPGDLTTHFFIAPIALRASNVGSYAMLLRRLRDVGKEVNNESLPTLRRLESAENYIRIARQLVEEG